MPSKRIVSRADIDRYDYSSLILHVRIDLTLRPYIEPNEDAAACIECQKRQVSINSRGLLHAILAPQCGKLCGQRPTAQTTES